MVDPASSDIKKRNVASLLIWSEELLRMVDGFHIKTVSVPHSANGIQLLPLENGQLYHPVLFYQQIYEKFKKSLKITLDDVVLYVLLVILRVVMNIKGGWKHSLS